MADKTRRVSKSIPGPFYVDDTCINCGACAEVAPEHFEMDDALGYSYVKRQPATDAERARCREAAEECPVLAIGDDGA